MNVKFNNSELPYQLPQSSYMRPDLILENVLTDYLEDDKLWVPSTLESVSFKPLLLHVSSGYYVNLLRVTKSGFLSRHRHSGDVQAFVLKGKWHYLEHDWIAEGRRLFCI
ncbi:cupin domain-containing protein [Halomonas sp. KM007]